MRLILFKVGSATLRGDFNAWEYYVLQHAVEFEVRGGIFPKTFSELLPDYLLRKSIIVEANLDIFVYTSVKVPILLSTVVAPKVDAINCAITITVYISCDSCDTNHSC